MIFPIVLFVFKLVINSAIFTFCVIFVLSMIYVWLRMIQGFIQGFNEDNYNLENKTPDAVFFDKDGKIGEYYDL